MTSLISDTSLFTLTQKYAYIQADVEGQMEYLNESSDSLLNINWVSFYDLEKNVDLMDWEQQSSIRALMSEKCLHRGEKKELPVPTKYIGNTIMAHLANFEYARVMTRCGTKGSETTFHTPCSKWKYCERCANAKRRSCFIKYNHVYACTVDPCYFVTITMDEKVEFTEGKREQILVHWDKMNAYVDLLYKKKILKGGIAIEEAAFDSYYPVPVMNPHLHVMCVGKEGLESHKFEGMKIDVRLIDNADHWVTELNYCHKAINFFNAYAYEWTPDNAEVINRNFRDMLDHHKEICKNRNQSRAFGILHGKNKSSIVKTTKEIKEAYTILKKEKITGQKKHKKIKCKGMFEEFSNGVKSHVTQKQASTIVKKKESTPWYKNPLILGAGGLALGAGAYGAGKLYNGGNNVVNDTFGKGVDDYIVNPIKGLFGGSNEPAPRIDPAPEKPALTNASVTRNQMQSTLLPEKPKTDFYALAATLNKPLPYSGEFPHLQGISPLRPELQHKGLSLVTSPAEASFEKALANSFDTKTNIAGTIASARAATLSDRARELKDEFADKTPDELNATIGGWEAEQAKLNNNLSYDKLRTTHALPQDGHDPLAAVKASKNLTGNSYAVPLRDAARSAAIPASIYDFGSMTSKWTAPIASAASSKLLGKGLTSAIGNVVGKINPLLAPLAAGIPDVGMGYGLTGDAVSDPNSFPHQFFNSVGVTDEDKMKQIGGGIFGAGSAGLTAYATPSIRTAAKRMLTSALGRAAAAGTATAGLSPGVTGLAMTTSVVASPVLDAVMDHNTRKFTDNFRSGDMLSTSYQQLLDAKNKMDTTGEAYALKALLNSKYFRNLGTSDPGVVKKIYDSIGPQAGNLMMTAKQEGIMGLLGRKAQDIMNNGKYAPVPEAPPPVYPTSNSNGW